MEKTNFSVCLCDWTITNIYNLSTMDEDTAGISKGSDVRFQEERFSLILDTYTE